MNLTDAIKLHQLALQRQRRRSLHTQTARHTSTLAMDHGGWIDALVRSPERPGCSRVRNHHRHDCVSSYCWG